jgi:hypothetical protein
MKEYTKPVAEKLEFDYSDNVTASNTVWHHGDVGHGNGMGGGCDHVPGHGNPKKPHP